MHLDNKIYNEIKEYCELNDIKTRDFINKILKEAFLREKYGDSPFKKSINSNEHHLISTNEDKKKDIIENVQKSNDEMHSETTFDLKENEMDSEKSFELKENENGINIKKKRKLN